MLFRSLVLSKNWDLHLNNKKRIRDLQAGSILDNPDDPYSLDEIFEIENKVENKSPKDPTKDPGESESENDNSDYDPLEGTSSAFFGCLLKAASETPSLSSEIYKNKADGLSKLNNKIIKNISESKMCGEGLAFNLPSKQVILQTCQAEPPSIRELAIAKCQPEKETESEYSQAYFAPPVPGTADKDPVLVKGDISPVLENEKINISDSSLADILQTEHEISKPNESNKKNSRKVGFKSFMTRFFDSDK